MGGTLVVLVLIFFWFFCGLMAWMYFWAINCIQSRLGEKVRKRPGSFLVYLGFISLVAAAIDSAVRYVKEMIELFRKAEEDS